MLQNIKSCIIICNSYFYDAKRFLINSQIFGNTKNKKKMQGHMLRIAHALEKGMVLPNPRKGFGLEKLEQLLAFTEKYKSSWGQDEIYAISVSCIKSLINHHTGDGVDCSDYLDRINKIEKDYKKRLPKSGKLLLSKSKIVYSLQKSPEDFFLSRYSIRKFSEEIIEEETLVRIATIAAKTPSVCNRQSCKVYFYTNPDLRQEILTLQDGNAGFGEFAPVVAIITSDLNNFYKSGERNQGFVDGGLYAMSIVYAAHALSIGTCMLNWSQGVRTDKRLRKLIGIPDSEIVITMIALGGIPNEVEVAASPRRNISDTCTINKAFPKR